MNLYCYCENDPVNKYDPSGHFSILALLISVAVALAFEVVEDAVDGNGWDHDWKDYLGAGISGLFGGLGGGIVHQIGFAFAGGMADAWLSGDLEQNGFFNTLGSIALSTGISAGIGFATKSVTSIAKASSLKKLSNNIANRKLGFMGITTKIGSKASKNGLSSIIRKSNWIGNIVSDKFGSSISGGLVSLGYGQVSDYFGLYF